LAWFKICPSLFRFVAPVTPPSRKRRHASRFSTQHYFPPIGANFHLAPFAIPLYNLHMQFSESHSPFIYNSTTEDAESSAMLRAVLTLFEKWQLKPAEIRTLLGAPSERTLQRWRTGQIASVPHDTQFRLGCLLGIHKALRFMFTQPERAYAWVRKPNTAFGGLSALAKMLQGAPTDLADVRNYLDAERAGW
jgi:hypothetical protein